MEHSCNQQKPRACDKNVQYHLEAIALAVAISYLLVTIKRVLVIVGVL